MPPENLDQIKEDLDKILTKNGYNVKHSNYVQLDDTQESFNYKTLVSKMLLGRAFVSSQSSSDNYGKPLALNVDISDPSNSSAETNHKLYDYGDSYSMLLNTKEPAGLNVNFSANDNKKVDSMELFIFKDKLKLEELAELVYADLCTDLREYALQQNSKFKIGVVPPPYDKMETKDDYNMYLSQAIHFMREGVLTPKLAE